MILSVFGDESADETRQRVFAMSGVFGTEGEWLKVESAWTAVTGGEVFHAADWEYAGRKREYRALVEVLASSLIGGIVYAIDLAAFTDVFPDTLRDSAYMKCFTRVVLRIAQTAETFNATISEPFTKIEYTFDRRPATEFGAARAYGSFIRDPGWSAGPLLASEVLFECRTNPRIQMADLIAREGMKDLDRKIGPAAFRERRSRAALGVSKRYKFFELGRAEFVSERVRHAELESDGLTQDAYHAWLARKRAPDTWDNRVRFTEYLDAHRGPR